jgi:glutathione S-transferase
MKVYGWAVSPWMARVLICLEEAGVEYELVPMSRVGGDHRRPEHLARNVCFSKIPLTYVTLTIDRLVPSSHSWRQEAE